MKPFIKQRRMGQLTKLLACYLGIFLFSTQSVNAQKVAIPCRPQVVLSGSKVDVTALNSTCEQPSDRFITPQAALQQLAKANVVYLGETHDSAEDHKIQLKIIQELQRRKPIAIAMEMFQRPYQAVIDRYLKGLSEQQLVAQTQYNQRWGFPWEYYAPIVRFAKAKKLPILALNTPTEVTRAVARAGLESLTPKQRQFIPPFSEIRTDNLEYRQQLEKIFQQHHHSGQGYSAGFERFFLAQVLWDETMAEVIAKFVQAHPNYQVVVLAGQGHVTYGYGIPSRVARRLNQKRLIQRSVVFSLPKDTLVKNNQAIADFIWQH